MYRLGEPPVRTVYRYQCWEGPGPSFWSTHSIFAVKKPRQSGCTKQRSLLKFLGHGAKLWNKKEEEILWFSPCKDTVYLFFFLNGFEICHLKCFLPVTFQPNSIAWPVGAGWFRSQVTSVGTISSPQTRQSTSNSWNHETYPSIVCHQQSTILLAQPSHQLWLLGTPSSPGAESCVFVFSFRCQLWTSRNLVKNKPVWKPQQLWWTSTLQTAPKTEPSDWIESAEHNNESSIWSFYLETSLGAWKTSVISEKDFSDFFEAECGHFVRNLWIFLRNL